MDDLITYADYQQFNPATEITSEEFFKLVKPVSRVIDALLFHAISLGRLDVEDHRLVLGYAACLEMSYAEQMGLGAFLLSDGRPVASESGSLGAVSDSVSYATAGQDSQLLAGGYPVSRDAQAYLASSGLIAKVRRIRA